MKKPHICMITSEFPPKSAGIGSSVYLLAKTLVKKGNNVTVLTRGQYFRESRRKIGGINVIELPFISLPPPLHLLYHGFFVNRTIKRLERRFDIIHLHTPLVPKVNSVLPKVISVHSLWREETDYFKDGKDLYSLGVKLFKKAIVNSELKTLRQSNLIIAYPKYDTKLRKLYKIEASSVYTTSGMIFSNPLSKAKHMKKYDVLFVGRLNLRKGVKELICSAKLIIDTFPKTKFLIIGDGSSKRWMMDEIRRSNILDNFTFMGFIPNNKLKKYFIQSSIFAMPSRYETFGLVIGEAMSYGLPVVATRNEGSTRLITNNTTGYLIKQNDHKNFARKIVVLMQDSKKREKMGQEGKKKVYKHFNPESVARQHLSIYRKAFHSNTHRNLL